MKQFLLISRLIETLDCLQNILFAFKECEAFIPRVKLLASLTLNNDWILIIISISFSVKARFWEPLLFSHEQIVPINNLLIFN